MEAKEETTQTQQNKDSASEANSTPKDKKETKENTEESRGTVSPVDGDGVESGVMHTTTKKIGKTFWNKPEKKNNPKEDKPGSRDSWPSLEEAVTDTVVQSSSSSTSPSTSTSTPSSPTDSSSSIPAASTSLLSTPPASTSAPIQTNAPPTNSSSSSTNKRGKKGMNWVPFKDIGPPPSSQFKNSNQQNQNHGHQNNLNNNNGHSRRRNNRDFNSDRTDRGEKAERTEKGDRPERGERVDRAERGERNDRGERGERGAERGDRGERHGDRNYRNNNFRHGRTRGRGFNNHFNNRQQNIQYPPSDRIPLFTPQYFPKEDLKELIVKQIEYYFSVENLCHDIFFRQHMDEEGWVPVTLIATFPRITQLSADIPLIIESVKTSQLVECKEEKFRLVKDWQTWLIPKASALLTTPLIPASNSVEKADIASSA